MMHITFVDKCIELFQFDSKDLLLDSLKQCQVGSILFGKEDSVNQSFFSVIISDKNMSRFGLGLCVENFGFYPHFLMKPETQRLILGFDSEIIFFDVAKKMVDKRLSLSMLFNKFIDLYNLKIVLGFYETGLVAMDWNGNKIWEFDVADVIVDDAIEGDIIIITLMEGEIVKLSLQDGKRL